MVDRKPPSPSSSDPDGDGVRVIEKARTAGRCALPWILLVVAVIGVAVAWRFRTPPAPSPSAAAVVQASEPTRPSASAPARRGSLPSMATDVPNGGPDDLANYFRPGDPEPTGAELIGALNDVGIRTGIGAFNPPGTSPPLEGLAVPEDFELPEGYVRHYQSTDAGEPIEAILMFAPDFTLHDANGRPIAMPGNRVVPPELAPPGLPPRRVRIPPPT